MIEVNRKWHLVISGPVQEIINNQPFNHVMFAGCIVCTCTMLDKAIKVPSDVVTWNNLQKLRIMNIN